VSQGTSPDTANYASQAKETTIMTDQLVLDARTGILVGSMAAIVRELVAGGDARLPSAEWLTAHLDAAHLDLYARTALESLRARLLAHGGSMLDAFGVQLGSW